jgi:hypothetical protein
MNKRDQEFLDKQLRRTVPPAPNRGVLTLMLVAVFLAGMTAGGYLYAFTKPLVPTKLAASAAPSAAPATIALPIAR